TGARARRQFLQHRAAPGDARGRRRRDAPGADRQPRLVLTLRRPRARARLARGQRVDNLESGRPEVRAAIDRAERFLGLTALLAAILAGVAIALGTRRVVERHLDGCAGMRCRGGAAQKRPPAAPALQGFLAGLVLLLGFALPPLMQLKDVPAVRVMRRETAPTPGAFASYVVAARAFGARLVWQAGDLKLGITVVGAFAAAVLGFFAVAWGALRLLTHRRVTRLVSRRLRYG